MLKMQDHYFFKKDTDIRAWLESHYVLSYELVKNETYGFVVDVNQSVYLENLKTPIVPVKFREIKGDFICSNSNLNHLEWAPHTVRYKFDVSNNNLTSLRGAPTFVGNNFDVSHNMLTTLRFCPADVRGNFDCSHNQISSLEGAPQKLYSFNGSHNSLIDLLHSPKNISKDFIVYDNKLQSLEGCPSFIGGSLFLDSNDLSELDFFPNSVGGVISLQNNAKLGQVQDYHEFNAVRNEYEKMKINRDKIYMERALPINHKYMSEGKDKREGKI